MELGADVPAQTRDLDDFNEVGRRVDAYALHAVTLELVLVTVVELVTVTVTFLNEVLLAVGLQCATTLDQLAVVGA